MSINPTTFDMAHIENALVAMGRKLDRRLTEIIEAIDNLGEECDCFEEYDD